MTTTVTSTSTTTTTLAVPSADRLPGKKLELKATASRPSKKKLFIASRRDGAALLTLGRGPESPDDPTLHGGRLIVASSRTSGDFTTTYPLDATTGTWTVRRKRGILIGWTFKGTGAIRAVDVMAGRTLAIRGKGEGLGHDLDDNPNPVGVRLEIGEHAYCLQFGGDTSFREGSFFRAKNAPTAAQCGP